MDNNYYLYIPIYREDNGYMFCYRIFQNIITKKYYVQSKDNLSLGKKDTEYIEKQFIDLFIETEPNKRIKGFKSLKKAIKAFDVEMD